MVMIVVLISGVGINHFLINALGIYIDSTRESMSVPFLQVARYVRDCGDSLSEEEIETIDAILDYDNLAENYVPEVSDKVKETYRSEATKEDWKEFWILWGRKLIERPVVYADAAINLAYGYFDPFFFHSGSLGYELHIRGRITSRVDEPVYSSYVFSDGVRNVLSQYTSLWQKNPGLFLFVNCGAYTWTGILLFVLLLRKRDYRGAVIFLIPALNVLICCVSPVNGLLRYMLPVMASMPLYVFTGMRPYFFHLEAKDSLEPFTQ